MRLARIVTALGFVALVVTAPLAAQEATVVSQDVATADGNATINLELDNGRVVSIGITQDGKIMLGDEVVTDLGEIASEVELATALLSNGESASEEIQRARALIMEKANLAFSNVAQSISSSDLQGVARISDLSEALQSQQDPTIDLTGSGVASGMKRLGSPQDIGNLDLDMADARISVGDVVIDTDETVSRTVISLRGDVLVRGTVDGNVIALNGNVRLVEGASVSGDAVAINGRVVGSHRLVSGEVASLREPGAPARLEPIMTRNVSGGVAFGRNLMTFLATAVALTCIGFGLTFFAPDQLEIVSQRIIESPARSFFAGLFAQPLVFPLLAMVTVGLIISIVGIILIPFAIPGVVLLIGLATLVGYLATARALGTRFATYRAVKRGDGESATPFGSMLWGLAIMLGLWLPAVLVSWIPGLNVVALVGAIFFTWILATAGLGAVITSGAGMKSALRRWRGRSAVTTGATEVHYRNKRAV